jgi:hypothetical protein
MSIPPYANTAQFLSEVRQTPWMQEYEKKANASFIEKFALAIHSNTTIITIAKIAAIILGLAAIATLPFSLAALGLAAIAIAVVGGLIAAIAVIAHIIIGKYLQPHNMSSHAFKEGEYKEDGIVYGKLSYEGHVPILTLPDMTKPFLAGKAQGYLMGSALATVRNRFETEDRNANRPTAAEMPDMLAEIRENIPKPYVEEMEGLVEGYNKWVNEQSRLCRPKEMTFNDLLLFHLMPDSLQFDPGYAHDTRTMEEGVDPATPQPSPKLGCTVVVAGSKEKGLTFARNMDWPSYGVAGTNSLIINRKGRGYDTAEVSMPGLVGTLTGMNSQGLSLALNVCSRLGSEDPVVKIDGVPAVFFNRQCLESCATVDEVSKLQDDLPVLGKYHLTVADKDGARAFQMKTDQVLRPVEEDGPRRLQLQKVERDWKPGAVPLITTNQRYDEVLHLHHSAERDRIIKKLFSEAQKSIHPDGLDLGALAEYSLSLPFVNNVIATHTVVMKPRELELAVAFDNAFSGSKKVQRVSAQRLFGSAPAA